MSNANVFARGVERAKKSKWTFGSVLLAIVITGYLIYVLFKISAYIEELDLALTPPTLPEQEWSESKDINPMGWLNEDSDWFRFATQGTATLPIPYDWFMALEEPASNPRWAILGIEAPLFTSDYIYGHGFIKSKPSTYNPDGLPIGFTLTPSIPFNGIDRHANAIGLTCAACHTGQIVYGDTQYVIDGGPAVTDLGLFSKSLGAALGQTVLSSKFVLFNGRFKRFAKRVLGEHDNQITRNQLKAELSAVLDSLRESVDVVQVTEGFTRNDALNRIGNQVFSANQGNRKNYHAINAPVTYPHIWTTSWFDWVQYDGSIMQPLVRNSGEALGVKAYLDMKGPNNQRYASSVNLNNLYKIERWLGGINPKVAGDQINGLRAPKWPDDFPAVDAAAAEKGAQLYTKHCKGCHLPEVGSASFWSDKYWRQIQYFNVDGKPQTTVDPYLKLKIIDLYDIGTDPAQAGVLAKRTVDTTGLNLDTQVCTVVSFEKDGEMQTALKYVPVGDSATGNFALSLGSVVERTNQQWFAQNFTPPLKQSQMEDGRPNCLQAGAGYKARPLNGVWATAPFLHNGSVASIYDLLTPAAERPRFVELGNPRIDTKSLGVEQSEEIKHLNEGEAAEPGSQSVGQYESSGYFVMDTNLNGNRNSGHSFEGNHRGYAKKGVVGPALSEEEKMALIEYLKTI